MKSLFLLLSLIILTSCGNGSQWTDLVIQKKDSDPRQFTKTNPILADYKNEFIKKHEYTLKKRKHIDHIPVNFGNTAGLGATTIGVCYSWPGGKREIIINQEWWNSASDCDRQVLINHELGHCALNRPHKNLQYNGYKMSLMNAIHLGGDNYCNNETAYDHELFTHDHSHLMEDV